MKHSINFYTDELQPKRELLTLNKIAASTLAIVIGLSIWFAVLTFKAQDAEQKVASLVNELKLAKQELSNLQQQLVKHNDSSGLFSQKQKLEQQIEAQSALLAVVGNQKSDLSINYHQVMQELTKHHHHDIWLSGFTFNKNNVVFDGYATDSSAVTLWMMFLQSSSSFRGREFGLLNIAEVDDETLQFKTATSLELLPSEGAQP